MAIKITNNAVTKLAAGINNSATSLQVTPGEGARFPTLEEGDWFPVTLIDVNGNLEIVRVTERSTDTFTIVRAQEGTAAIAFSAGDRVELRMTAGTLTGFFEENQLEIDTKAAKAANLSDLTDAAAARSNIGLGNVNNTSDANKPISTATQTALNAKLNLSGGTMTGALTLAANATANLHPVTKQQFDAAFAALLTGLSGMAVFESSGTWTKPAGVKKALALVIGGGGAGVTRTSTGFGSGGGGGGVAIKVCDVSAVASVSVTVGAGGSGGNGGTSSFGSFCSATGGTRGANNTNSENPGGTGIGGDINFTGSPGLPGGSFTFISYLEPTGDGGSAGRTLYSAYAGPGGGCFSPADDAGRYGGLGLFGGRGGSRTAFTTNSTFGYADLTGADATGFGCGGSGASRFGGTQTGGKGSPGVVILLW